MKIAATKKMWMTKHRWIVVVVNLFFYEEINWLIPIYPMLQAGNCALILWFGLLFTTNLYYTSTFKDIKPLQYRILEPRLYNDTLVNLYNFEFVFNNASLCMKSMAENKSIIVIMVHTARTNFDRRYAIRNTWGSIKIFRQWHLHLAFLIGSDPGSSPEIDAQLWDESKEHGDIIMGNFVDSYRNLTYKHLMG